MFRSFPATYSIFRHSLTSPAQGSLQRRRQPRPRRCLEARRPPPSPSPPCSPPPWPAPAWPAPSPTRTASSPAPSCPHPPPWMTWIYSPPPPTNLHPLAAHGLHSVNLVAWMGTVAPRTGPAVSFLTTMGCLRWNLWRHLLTTVLWRTSLDFSNSDQDLLHVSIRYCLAHNTMLLCFSFTKRSLHSVLSQPALTKIFKCIESVGQTLHCIQLFFLP